MFFGIHNHSFYSNARGKDSINRISDLIEYTHSLGHCGLALTDHEAISGAVQAETYFNKVKDKPGWEDYKLALGNEIYLCPDWVCKDNASSDRRLIFPHFILVALDAEGHKQIRQLSTRAWTRAFMYRGIQRVPTYLSDIEDIIEPNKGHLIASTACIGGDLPIHILSMRDYPSNQDEIWQGCIQWIQVMREIFGEDNFFLELQPSFRDEQRYVNEKLVELSQITGTPYIITTDAHYLKKEDAKIHEIYLKSNEIEREVAEFYSTTYCMSEEEIHSYMDDNIGYEAVEKGFANTTLIYDRVQSYSLKRPMEIPYLPLDESEPSRSLYQKYVQYIPLLKEFYESDKPCNRHLVREITKALEKEETFRNQKAYDALQDNLNTIKISSEKMGMDWSAYLLNEKDYIDITWTKGNSITGAARGSGCGFFMLHVLGITQINPLVERTATYPWRFLNPERVSVLDIDCDIEGNKRESVIQAFRDVYGEDRVSKVLTYTTEGSRAAILTIGRGLGYDNDLTSYIASLIVADRGKTRSLRTMYYGDEENPPVSEFKRYMDQYPDLWDGAQKIEGIVSGCGSHAGGILFTNRPFTDSISLMRTKNDDIVSCFDLEEVEECGLIKIDLLSVEGMDKIRATLDLLLEDGVIKWQGSLRSTYEKYIGVKTLERDDHRMWQLLWDRKVMSLFQMEKDSGIQALSLVKPDSVDQLASLNSVIRLMPQNKGDEVPLQKYGRFRHDISLWYKEMSDAGLTEEEQKILEPLLLSTAGISLYQEEIMVAVQLPEAGGFSLQWADRLRKAVAKKNNKDFEELQKEFYDNAKEKGLSMKFVDYIWKFLVLPQKNYSFNAAHCLSYSIVALQQLNLCYKYGLIYWQTACLLTDSGSLDESDSGVRYGKIGIAIANMQREGVMVTPPLINEAYRGFKPDAQNNRIIFAFKAINGVGDNDVEVILANRPYTSFDDFATRIIEPKLLTNSTIIALIQAGTFTAIDDEDPRKTLAKYISRYIYTPNESLTLANIAKIQAYNILPDDLNTQLHIYNYKAYVTQDDFVDRFIINEGKKVPKCGYHDRALVLDSLSQPYFQEHFSEESVIGTKGDKYIISEKKFIKEWESITQDLRNWIKSPQALDAYNKAQYFELWQKYGEGTLSHYEMMRLSCYLHPHELANIDLEPYGVVNYFDLPRQPEAYSGYRKKSKDTGEWIWVPKFNITRLAGTVLNADNNHHTVSVLTLQGVVNIKFNKGQYAFYNRRMAGDNSWFKRGTLILVCGYRQDDNFRAYRYNDTIYNHTVNKIIGFKNDGTLELMMQRPEAD